MSKYRHLVLKDGRRREMPDADNFSTTSGGREVVLKEIIYAGLATQSFTLDATTVYTLDGVDHRFGTAVAADGTATASIVASGLKMTRSVNTAETYATLGATTSTTGLQNLITSRRFAFGRWAFWMRVASYTLPASGCWHAISISGTYPRQYARVGRTRGINGQANDATGGVWTMSAFNGAQTDRAGGDYDTHDVFMVYCNARAEFHMFSGVWSSGWPSFENLTWQGYAQHHTRTTSNTTYNHYAISAWSATFNIGGSANASEVIIDRARITGYD